MEQLFEALNTPMTTFDKLNGWGNLKSETTITPTKEVLFKRIQLSRFDQKQDGAEGGDSPQQEGKVDKPKQPAKAKANPKGLVCNDVSRWNLVVGKIITCKNHPDAENLYVEEIDIGDKKIQVVSGLAKHIPLHQMVGRLVVIVKNMKATTLRGALSEGMVIAAIGANDTVELVTPPNGAHPGERIKFAGYPDDNVADVLNKNIIEKVKAHLKTNSTCVATYKDVPFVTSSGVCTVATLANAQLG